MRDVRVAVAVCGLILAGTMGGLTPGALALLCGDADGNGIIAVTDGVNVLRATADLPSSCTLQVCDVDGNGGITVTDGVNVLRAAAGLPHVCRPILQPCGGIVGIRCPTGQQCEDIPSDDCDPLRGGADCPGQCEPPAPGDCSIDGDCPRPGAPCTLCADGSFACPISFCDLDKGQCRLAFQACPVAPCGGFAVLGCPEGQECIDDPRDACDRNAGGIDCSGVCVL